MSSSSRPLGGRFLFVVAVIAGGAPCAVFAQGDFHITFGTTGDPEHRNADTATIVVEAENGDLIVAGSGASFWSDTGHNHTNPMVARIDSHGELQWQRVYDDLENHRITAFASRGEAQYMVLEPTIAPERLFLDGLVRPVTLRQIDERGKVSEVLGTLEGFWVLQVIPVVDRELSHFLIVGKKGTTNREAIAADVQLFHLDLQGRVTEMSSPAGVNRIEHLQHIGGQEFLFSQWHHGPDHVVDALRLTDAHTDIVRLDRTGETEIVRSIADALCRPLVASRDRIFCAEAPSLRTDQTNDAIVAYSAAGQELWRHDLERGMHVEQMHLLGSGELIYSYHEIANTIVSRLSPSGGLLWRQTLRSAGQYTFLTAIESLKSGRLAFLGSTGPWHGFVSTDTNAMLLVTDASASDLNAPEILSNIIDLL